MTLLWALVYEDLTVGSRLNITYDEHVLVVTKETFQNLSRSVGYTATDKNNDLHPV